MKAKTKSSCECCSNYVYDEEFGYYECEVNLDEDEMVRFLQDKFYNCPYFQLEDEYKIVRKQMQQIEYKKGSGLNQSPKY